MVLVDWGGSGRLHAPTKTNVRKRPARHETIKRFDLLIASPNSHRYIIRFLSFPINSELLRIILVLVAPPASTYLILSLDNGLNLKTCLRLLKSSDSLRRWSDVEICVMFYTETIRFLKGIRRLSLRKMLSKDLAKQL